MMLEAEWLAEKLYCAYADSLPNHRDPRGFLRFTKSASWIELTWEERQRWRAVSDCVLESLVRPVSAPVVEDWHGKTTATPPVMSQSVEDEEPVQG